MSLLQGVLRTHILDSQSGRTTPHDSDDELVGVVSSPGTPASGSRPSSRPASPGPGSVRHPRRALHVASTPHGVPSDPLRAFHTEVSQRIFSQLSIKDLARCARVSKKWSKSQTINYVWFQHYRRENFHDDSLPPGKWTKRESKQNWVYIYFKTYTKDPLWTKFSVCALWTIDALCVAFSFHLIYQYFITNYFNPVALLVINWSFKHGQAQDISSAFDET
ncbi:predicted protein [Postia placenta Mad-698-R]|nr:predicted protein [Postia placenta Mad-698-R]